MPPYSECIAIKYYPMRYTGVCVHNHNCTFIAEYSITTYCGFSTSRCRSAINIEAVRHYLWKPTRGNVLRNKLLMATIYKYFALRHEDKQLKWYIIHISETGQSTNSNALLFHMHV